MNENFREKKERLDSMLAQEKISKIEYDRFLNMLNLNVAESNKCDINEEEICIDAEANNNNNNNVDEINTQVCGCLDRNIFIAMKEKDLITDDELTHVKDKYFDEKPKHTASKSIPAEKSMTKAFIIGLVVITVFFILFLLTALNNDPTKATKTNQQNNQIVSENQTFNAIPPKHSKPTNMQFGGYPLQPIP